MVLADNNGDFGTGDAIVSDMKIKCHIKASEGKSLKIPKG
jgi:hypothetical protein